VGFLLFVFTTQEVAPRVKFRLTSFFNGGVLPSCFIRDMVPVSR